MNMHEWANADTKQKYLYKQKLGTYINALDLDRIKIPTSRLLTVKVDEK